MPKEDYQKTFIWSIPNPKDPKGKHAVKGTMVQPAGGGEPTLDGSFVTPEHPDGISINDLNKPENKKEKEALVKALKEKFDAEKAGVDKYYKTLKSVMPGFHGSFYYSLIPVRVGIKAPADTSVGTPVTLSASARTELGPVVEGVYSWDLGNGAFAAGPSATVVYERPGNYKVRVTVRDEIGARGRTFLEITIKARPRN